MFNTLAGSYLLLLGVLYIGAEYKDIIYNIGAHSDWH